MLLLRTLGELQLEGDDNAALSSRRKELLLLAYLARRASRTASRAELAGLLWHDRDDTRARQSLRQAVVELKRLLGDGMVFQADRIVLAENALTLDAAAFEDDLTSGRLLEAVGRRRGDGADVGIRQRLLEAAGMGTQRIGERARHLHRSDIPTTIVQGRPIAFDDRDNEDVHSDPEFETLKGLAPFEALIRID